MTTLEDIEEQLAAITGYLQRLDEEMRLLRLHIELPEDGNSADLTDSGRMMTDLKDFPSY
jgi:hypothetical protein